MDFDGIPTIGLDGHQWAMATTASICGRLYTQPPMYRAIYMLRNICATFAQCRALLRTVAHHRAALRTIVQHCVNVAQHTSILMKYT